MAANQTAWPTTPTLCHVWTRDPEKMDFRITTGTELVLIGRLVKTMWLSVSEIAFFIKKLYFPLALPPLRLFSHLQSKHLRLEHLLLHQSFLLFSANRRHLSIKSFKSWSVDTSREWSDISKRCQKVDISNLNAVYLLLCLGCFLC